MDGIWRRVWDRRGQAHHAREGKAMDMQGPAGNQPHCIHNIHIAILNLYSKNANRYYLWELYTENAENCFCCDENERRRYTRSLTLKTTTIDGLNAINFKDFVVVRLLYKELSYYTRTTYISLIKPTTRRLNNLSQATTITAATPVNIPMMLVSRI